MNAFKNKKAVFLTILGFIIITTCSPYIFPLFLARNEVTRLNLYDKPPRTSNISGTIHINNNWTDAKIAGICNGSGSWNNPYVIKDFLIDGGYSSNCIKIQNSSVYFRIENCTLFNAGAYWGTLYAGILLDHTNNGLIIQNTCSNNSYGIRLTSYSRNNTIYKNNANDNHHRGLVLDTFCSNNTIKENNFNNNTSTGIWVRWNSHNNTISKNNATKNVIGLVISTFSELNNIVDNNFSYNTFPSGSSTIGETYGIRINRAENNYIAKNIVNFNGDGINIYESKFNSILNNSIFNNGFFGIRLIRSDENRLLRNKISFNDQIGIKIEESESNFVTFNEINNHIVGIHLDSQSKCNVIVNNTFSGNVADITDYQRICGENGLTPPPIDIVLISLAIIGIMILITGAVLVLRNLLRIKMRNRNEIEKKEIK